jgi:hypothetical protein
LFTGGEELARPAMEAAGDFAAAACARGREMQGCTGEGKRAHKDSCSCFIEQGREREWRPGPIGH